jgi:hypothetical protein
VTGREKATTYRVEQAPETATATSERSIDNSGFIPRRERSTRHEIFPGWLAQRALNASGVSG